MNKITHIDTSTSTILPFNLTGNFLHHINELGEWDRHFILYDWGTRQERAASVDWLDDDRKILTFEHFKRPTLDLLHPGRIQIQKDLPSVRELQEYKRMRILFDYPLKSWLVLAEWWSGASWLGDEYACRISMGLRPDGLTFYMDIQRPDGLWANIWVAPVVPVPIKEWFDLYVVLQAGDKDTGLFRVAIREPGGLWNRVVDIHDYTYNPDSPELMYPNYSNPAMLYMGAESVEAILNSNQLCRVQWRMIEQWVSQ